MSARDVEKLFEYVENFEKMYLEEFPNRIQPLLLAENEFGVKKMVCTTIRPTKLKYPELIHVDKCSRFVADFIEYEPLEEPESMPSRLRSPNYLLNHRAGTCFELSTLLASLLLGNGYDAFVVCGFASQQCCENDQTYGECPSNFSDQFDELLRECDEQIGRHASLADEKDEIGVSSYWKMMENREKSRVEELNRVQREEELRKIAEMEKIPDDRLRGKRVHSWILLMLDSKEVKLIEPSTGLAHAVDDHRYHTIESVWNGYNYWVNTNPSLSLSQISFDLTNSKNWQHLLAIEPWHVYSKNVDQPPQRTVKAVKHFEMPRSWVATLKIPNDEYVERFPNGYKRILYKKTAVENFGPSRESKLVRRLIKYDDYEFHKRFITICTFDGRDDKLVESKTNHKNGKVIQRFANGQEDTLKRLEYFVDLEPEWKHLKIQFNVTYRLDNAHTLIVDEDEMKITFNRRDDYLQTRIVKFNTEETSRKFDDIKNSIREMIDIFGANDSSNVERRIFQTNKILLFHRYEKNEILQRKVKFDKINCEECETRLIFCEKCNKLMNDDSQLLILLKIEQVCLSDVHRLIDEAQKIFFSRHRGDNSDA